ncbi:sodium:proton antiporter [Halobacteriales archaeon QS_1_68_17]|nr:MAG: sodium:proton antiporter [Halobacteriales archaeon QS_1_68_17]
MVTGGIDVALLVDLLAVFIIAAVVGILVAKVGRFPYTVALLLAGVAASVLGVTVDIELSHDLILLVLLPPLLFEGAATTDLERFRRNLAPILTLAVPGLLISIAVLGTLGTVAFGFAPLVALLFAAMILPTDPVSVLALFEELGAPDRLAVLVEGESLINDGVGVVVFTALLTLVVEGATTSTLLDPATLWNTAVEIAVVSAGGLIVGLGAGYVVYRVMVNLDEHMTEIVLTIVLAYGSFILAEHYLGVSGVIATVVAGLFVGNRGADYAMSSRTKISVFNTWETGAFIVNTFIFVMIGVVTPIRNLLAHADMILVAIPLVLVARAAVVYPLTALVNRFSEPTVSRSYQHVMVWGGLHASIPIALVLGLPTEGILTPDLRTDLRAMVFAVAAFSLVVQGLTMGRLLDRLGVVTRSDAEELFELLVGRSRAVDAALEAAAELHDRGDIPREVYEDFTAEYEREKADLDDAISQLLDENPQLRREQLLTAERQVLQREKSAIMGTVRTGTVGDDVGERLLEEVYIKLDRLHEGESTVEADREAYEEFWRSRAADYGLDGVAVPDAEPAER